jgi:hypothetical protein
VKYLLTLSFLVVLKGVFSQTIVINKDHIVINGTRLDSASLLSDYIVVLGEPDRKFEGANNIYTFDDLGIYLYENYHDGNKIIEVSFDFRKDYDFDFSPKHKFRGTILLPDYDLKLDKHTGIRKIRKKCEKHQNKSLELEFGDSQFKFHTLLLLFGHNFWLTKTEDLTIDFD